jgi:hypothetical protein
MAGAIPVPFSKRAHRRSLDRALGDVAPRINLRVSVPLKRIAVIRSDDGTPPKFSSLPISH